MTPSTLIFVFLVLILFISYLRYLYYWSNMKARQEQTLFLLDKFAHRRSWPHSWTSEKASNCCNCLAGTMVTETFKALALTFQIISIFLLILLFLSSLCLKWILETDPQHTKQGWSLAFLWLCWEEDHLSSIDWSVNKWHPSRAIWHLWSVLRGDVVRASRLLQVLGEFILTFWMTYCRNPICAFC